MNRLLLRNSEHGDRFGPAEEGLEQDAASHCNQPDRHTHGAWPERLRGKRVSKAKTGAEGSRILRQIDASAAPAAEADDLMPHPIILTQRVGIRLLQNRLRVFEEG